jgi:hypothetical protein
MTNERICTGAIVPRDYGITIKHAGQKFFFNPLNYAIGELLLETNAEIKGRIREKAEREGLFEEELLPAFLEAVERKEGSKNILSYSRHTCFERVKLYGNVYSARAKSKSKIGPKFYHVHIEKLDKLAYSTVYSDAPEGVWGEVKVSGIPMTTQGAALDTALYRKQRLGMHPRDLPEPWEIPFTFFDRGRAKERYRLLTDALFDYYVENKTHYVVNRELMEQKSIFTGALKQEIENDTAWFSVVRNNEGSIDSAELSSEERKYYASVKSLEKRIKQRFEDKAFSFLGYCLEFKGTPYEVVAQRFAQKNTSIVYDLCMSKEIPPLLVKKVLDERDSDWIEQSSIDQQAQPVANIGQTYRSIDDRTRRQSYATVLVPNAGIFIPENLAKVYAKVVQEIKNQ